MSFKPWKVLQLKLEEGVPDLSAQPDLGGVYLVFWWRGVPLGQAEILASQLPIAAPQLLEVILTAVTPAIGDHLFAQGFKAPLPILRNYLPADHPPELEPLLLDGPLARLEEKLALVDDIKAAPVSIIVCTRERPEALRRCLEALRGLACKPQEIIVVDNAPTSAATRQVTQAFPEVTYVLEPTPGLSAARNAGIRASLGEFIAFTDDDVVVHADWLARLLRAFADPEVMAVTGLVLTAELETEAQHLFHRGNGGFGWGYRSLLFDRYFFETMKPLGAPVWHIGAGANMAFRRELFDRAGDFDERLGAGASGCSEDSEMWYRVLAEGWKCRYEPTAVVYHHHRSEVKDLKAQMHAYLRGHMASLLVQFERYGHRGNLRRAFAILPGYYGKMLWRWAWRGFRPRESTLLVEALGWAAGVGYFLRHKQAPRASLQRAFPQAFRVPAKTSSPLAKDPSDG